MTDITKQVNVNTLVKGESINPLTADPLIIAISFTGPTLRASFNHGPDQTSNESAGIWFNNGRAWKIFRKDGTFKKRNEDYKTAKDRELPIGVAVTLEKGTVVTTYEGKPNPVRKTTNGYVIVAPRFSGEFFQGVDSFKLALKDAGITKLSPEFPKLRRDFELARDIKLQDIQGFFARTSTPVIFTDIHIGTGSEPAQKFLDALNALPDRLY